MCTISENNSEECKKDIYKASKKDYNQILANRIDRQVRTIEQFSWLDQKVLEDTLMKK